MSHNVTTRFDFSDTSKYASIPLYIGVSATFTTIFIYIQSELSPLQCCADDNECCPNFYYFHFLSQVRMYYPGAREKMEEIFRKEHKLWKAVIQKAKESGEIKQDTDV